MAITKVSNSTHTRSITLHNVLYVLNSLTRGESATRLLGQRAAHGPKESSNPILIDAARYSVIDMGKYYIPLDQ